MVRKRANRFTCSRMGCREVLTRPAIPGSLCLKCHGEVFGEVVIETVRLKRPPKFRDKDTIDMFTGKTDR